MTGPSRAAVHAADELLLGVRPRAARRRRAGDPRPRARPTCEAAAAGRRSTTSRRPTGPAGRRCAPGRTTSTATTRSSTAWFGARQLPRPVRGRPPQDQRRSPHGRARHRRRRRRRRQPRRRAARGRRPASPRCSGTATWPTCAPTRRPGCDGDDRALRPAAAATAAPSGVRRGAAATIDPQRTLRAMLRADGRAGRVERWRRRRDRPRRLVLLVDVSGSMAPYADALLRLAHRLHPGGPRTRGTEVFTLGTRLTRVTRAMRHARPRAGAASRPGSTVPDWSGGTRLGETLKVFLDRWGQRGHGPRRRRRGLQRRLGARRRGRCSASRWAGCTGSPTGWCG